MRFIYLLFTTLLIALLSLGYTPGENSLISLCFLEGEKEPHLPNIPFDYQSITIPDHLLNTPHSTADPHAFDDLSNEIVTLGRVLFYDEQLSVNNNISCATCHQQKLSFADDARYSLGVNELTQRNSPQLNDLGWANKEGFLWDLSEANLENMIMLPLINDNEIGMTDWETFTAKLNAIAYYPPLAEAAFGTAEMTLEQVRVALAQFIRSMTTFDSKFDRVQRGEAFFSAQQAEGFEVFRANCEVCHSEGRNELIGEDSYPDKLLYVPAMFDNRKDWGEDPGGGAWVWYMEGRFKIPTLRNIALTAPYMHDGRFANLREVIDHYSYQAVIGTPDWSLVPKGGFHFTKKEREALEAFLKTLTDKNITEHEKWSDPFAEVLTSTAESLPAIATELFPNPSSGLTYLTFDNPGNREIRVDLTNMKGELIRKLSTHEKTLVTDVSQLAAGIYFLRMERGAQVEEKQLIVQ